MPKKSSQKPPAQLSLPKKATRIKPLRSTGNGASPKQVNPNTKGHTTQLYVHLPPSGRWHMEDVSELSNGFIAETDLPLKTRLDLQAREIQFREGESAGALRLFVASIEAGLYPPLPILKRFAIAASNYLSGEAKSLDEFPDFKDTIINIIGFTSLFLSL